MSKKPGPRYIELNSAIADSFTFVCLKDDVKAAFFLWALRWPEGDLPSDAHLGEALGKSKDRAFAIKALLLRSGFIAQTPGGKYMLAGGWARWHKTSTARSTKHRAEKVNGNAIATPIATLQSALQWAVDDASSNGDCNVASTLQKEIPLRNPLRKTSTNPANAGSVEGARERAALSGKSLISRDYWPKDAAVPPSWQALARQKRAILGMPEVDVAVVAEKFSLHHSATQNQPRTWGEWQAQFIKFALDERGKSHGSFGRSSVPSTLRDLADIAYGTGDGAVVVPN